LVLKPEDFFFRQVFASKFEDEQLTIEEMEKRMIVSAIDKNAGNMSMAAEKLGITRQTLYNKIKKYGL
jgi:transcriptional regulator of acetoin/glycerol metabolism